MNTSNSLITHAIIPVFILINISTALLFFIRKPTNTFKSYAGGEKKVPTLLLIMTLSATLMSGSELRIFNGVLHYGILESVRLLTMIIGALFVTTLLLPTLAQSKQYLTVGDVIGHTYGPFVQMITGLFLLGLSFFEYSRNVKILLFMNKYLLDTNHDTDAWIDNPSFWVISLLLIAAVYILLGGAQSMRFTHTLQMTTGLILLLFLSRKIHTMAGSFEGLWQHIPEDKITLPNHPTFYSFLQKNTFRLPLFILLIITPMLPRVAVLESKKQLWKAGLWSTAIYSFLALLLLFLGLGSLSLNEELGIYGENVHFFMFLRSIFTHKIALYSLYIGVLSLLLSSIDTYLHISAITLVHDIITPLLKLFKKEKLLNPYKLIITRVTTACLLPLFILITLFLNFEFSQHPYLYWTMCVISLTIITGLTAAMLDE